MCVYVCVLVWCVFVCVCVSEYNKFYLDQTETRHISLFAFIRRSVFNANRLNKHNRDTYTAIIQYIYCLCPLLSVCDYLYNKKNDPCQHQVQT